MNSKDWALTWFFRRYDAANRSITTVCYGFFKSNFNYFLILGWEKFSTLFQVDYYLQQRVDLSSPRPSWCYNDKKLCHYNIWKNKMFVD